MRRSSAALTAPLIRVRDFDLNKSDALLFRFFLGQLSMRINLQSKFSMKVLQCRIPALLVQRKRCILLSSLDFFNIPPQIAFKVLADSSFMLLEKVKFMLTNLNRNRTNKFPVTNYNSLCKIKSRFHSISNKGEFMPDMGTQGNGKGAATPFHKKHMVWPPLFLLNFRTTLICLKERGCQRIKFHRNFLGKKNGSPRFGGNPSLLSLLLISVVALYNHIINRTFFRLTWLRPTTTSIVYHLPC